MECPRCKDGTKLILEVGNNVSHDYNTYSLRCRKCSLHEFIERGYEVPPFAAFDDLKTILKNTYYPKPIPADRKAKRRKQYSVVGPRAEQRKRHYSRFLEKTLSAGES